MKKEFITDKSACQIMKDHVRHTNGQFYSPNNIISGDEMKKWMTDENYKPKNINNKTLSAIPKDEWEKMRHEEQCILSYRKGQYQKECKTIENTNKNSLAGGKSPFSIQIPESNTHPVYDFHNHPLYRENIPNATDILTYVVEAGEQPHKQLDNFISCVGELSHTNKPNVFCYRLSPKMQQKIIQIKKRMDNLEKKLQPDIDSGKLTESDIIKHAQWFDDQMKEWKSEWDKKWKKVIDANANEELYYVIQQQDGETYEFKWIPTIKQRKQMHNSIEKEFDGILEFNECE